MLSLSATVARVQAFGRTLGQRAKKRIRSRVRNRRGTALILSMILTMALAGVATSAIYLGGNATILSATIDRERDFKYASEAALAMGKSRINYDALAVPDTGYTQLLSNAYVPGTDGKPIPDVTVNMYVGPTSARTGQFGRFVSVVTEARDTRGARFVRRLELTQESFAKFAYWTDLESNMGQIIYFQNGDQLWGPVWSNSTIYVSNTNGAPTFWNSVGTAKTINGASMGIFKAGYQENQRPITLPSNSNLSNLPGYAAAGGLSFTAVNNTGVDNVRSRIEFVWVDLNADTKYDDNEGFLKFYNANTAAGPTSPSDWVRGDFADRKYNCGAWYNTQYGRRFYSISLHNQAWLINWLKSTAATGGLTLNPNLKTTDAQYPSLVAGTVDQDATQKAILEYTGSGACFLGGAPQLVGVEKLGNANYPIGATDPILFYGGNATTTSAAKGNYGTWLNWGGVVDPSVTAVRPDAQQLFPLYRGLNPGTKGVIYVNGTVGISGTIRAHVTLYASSNVAILDDLRYVADPSTTNCKDILGIIASNNIMVADNALNGPQKVNTGSYRNYNTNQDVYIQGVMMAINTSFGAENYNTGPIGGTSGGNNCEGKSVGRGCLYLLGGLIQYSRGPVGQSSGSGAYGYVKRYSYDRCALYNPPPYFPTTGRYLDNRYYEIDPNKFDVKALYNALTPSN